MTARARTPIQPATTLPAPEVVAEVALLDEPVLVPVAVPLALPEDDAEVALAVDAVPVAVAVFEPVPFTLLALVATANPVLAGPELEEEPLTRVVAALVEVAVPVEAVEEAAAVDEAEELEEDDDEPSVMLNWPCFPCCQHPNPSAVLEIVLVLWTISRLTD